MRSTLRVLLLAALLAAAAAVRPTPQGFGADQPAAKLEMVPSGEEVPLPAAPKQCAEKEAALKKSCAEKLDAVAQEAKEGKITKEEMDEKLKAIEQGCDEAEAELKKWCKDPAANGLDDDADTCKEKAVAIKKGCAAKLDAVAEAAKEGKITKEEYEEKAKAIKGGCAEAYAALKKWCKKDENALDVSPEVCKKKAVFVKKGCAAKLEAAAEAAKEGKITKEEFAEKAKAIKERCEAAEIKLRKWCAGGDKPSPEKRCREAAAAVAKGCAERFKALEKEAKQGEMSKEDFEEKAKALKKRCAVAEADIRKRCAKEGEAGEDADHEEPRSD